MMPNLLDGAPPTVTLPAFDSLPPEVRAAIAGADFPFDPRIAAARLSRGTRPGRIVAEIELFKRRPQPWW